MTHLSPGIRRVIACFEKHDLSELGPAFGARGLDILERWWRGEELALARLVGDIWSPVGVLGERAILRQAACANIGQRDRVLDVACGIGGPARILARRCQCRVHGVDISAEAVQVARGLTFLEGLQDSVTFQAADRSSLPFCGATFDVVWGHGGWGRGEDLTKTWLEAVRVLRCGGVVCCGAASEDVSWIGRLGFSEIRYYPYAGPLRKESLELFLKEMQESREALIEQAGQAVWDMFFNQKTTQLAALDEDVFGILVAVKGRET